MGHCCLDGRLWDNISWAWLCRRLYTCWSSSLVGTCFTGARFICIEPTSREGGGLLFSLSNVIFVIVSALFLFFTKWISLFIFASSDVGDAQRCLSAPSFSNKLFVRLFVCLFVVLLSIE